MVRSTYAQPLPPERRDEAASAHSGDGEPVPGRFHTYPEMAAAGLWTTPSDLAALAVEVQRTLAGEEGRILTPEMAREMLTLQAGAFGLGFSVSEEGGSAWFSHGGANRGFRAMFLAMADEGKGVVVMTNGDGGSDLAGEVIRAVAREYGWPAQHPVPREVVPLDAGTTEALEGTWAAAGPGAPDGLTLELFTEGHRLLARAPSVGWSRRTLMAASADTLFVLEGPFELTLERDDGGDVTALLLLGAGRPLRFERR
jgi:hypothetical protein